MSAAFCYTLCNTTVYFLIIELSVDLHIPSFGANRCVDHLIELFDSKVSKRGKIGKLEF